MTMISSYFAQVGVGIDKSSVNAVKTYLGRIEKQFLSFQRRSQKTLDLPMRVRVDRLSLQKDIQRSLTLVSKSNKSRFLLEARLSNASLLNMRNQVKTSLSGIIVNPRINPRINSNIGGRGVGAGGAGTRGRGRNTDRTTNRGGDSFNPWHNPMMIGGGTGAFMRYGLFSLPMVAGVFGLNALSNTSAELQGQRIAMRMTAGESMGEDGKMRDGDYYLNFLDKLGDRLGKTTQMMTPFFTQMLAGAKGTALEPHLESGFENLLQYSSVMGLNDESTKGAIRAFVQMIGKQQIMAEELRGQAAEHLPPVIRIMANAVAGGDVKKLNDMMAAGQLDPNKHLPLLFDQLRDESEPYLDEYLRSQRFKSGFAKKKAEDWVKKFLAGGAEEGITSVFDAFGASIEASIPYAEALGDAFSRASHILSAMILVPKEIGEWWKGIDGKDNFMTVLFGKSNESEFVSAVKNAFTQISDAIEKSMETSKTSLRGLITLVEYLASIMVPIVRTIGDMFEISTAYDLGGVSGVKHVMKRQSARREARDQAKNDFASQGDIANMDDIEARADVIMSDWDRANPAPNNIRTSAPWWRKSPGQLLFDSVAGVSNAGLESVERDGHFNPVNFIRQVSGSPIPTPQIPNQPPLFSTNTFDPAYRVPSNIPYFTDGMSGPGNLGAIEHKINLEITGTMKVDGTVEANVNELTFAESIKDTLKTVAEDAITEHYRGAIPQFHNVAQ